MKVWEIVLPFAGRWWTLYLQQRGHRGLPKTQCWSINQKWKGQGAPMPCACASQGLHGCHAAGSQAGCASPCAEEAEEEKDEEDEDEEEGAKGSARD